MSGQSILGLSAFHVRIFHNRFSFIFLPHSKIPLPFAYRTVIPKKKFFRFGIFAKFTPNYLDIFIFYSFRFHLSRFNKTSYILPIKKPITPPHPNIKRNCNQSGQVKSSSIIVSFSVPHLATIRKT